jgi:hypothetical protein
LACCYFGATGFMIFSSSTVWVSAGSWVASQLSSQCWSTQ